MMRGAVMKVLVILNHNPYDGTDLTWNALRLSGKLFEDGVEVRIFLMNDAVDLARDGIIAPEGFHDLVQMIKDFISKGIKVDACGTCQARCGIHKGDPYYAGVNKSTMAALSEYVRNSDQVLTF
jgi:uncharacterized protein involved in oxidation of intracellular sulfur